MSGNGESCFKIAASSEELAELLSKLAAFCKGISEPERNTLSSLLALVEGKRFAVAQG